MKLSIIIPVYNVERYLEQCLNSCFDQDFSPSEYEVIAVNDGSTDKSLYILQKYESMHTNMTVLNQENKRQGGARNYGLSIAKGEYIWFVDSDDWIKNNCLKNIFSSCYSADIILFPGTYIVKEDKISFHRFILPDSYSSISKSFLEVTPHGYLFRKSFLEDYELYFLEKTFFEDIEFIPKAFYLTKCIEFIKEPVYYYRIHSESTTSSTSFNKIKDFLIVADKLSDYKNSIKTLSKEWDNFFSKYIESLLNSFMTHWISLSKVERKALLKNFKNNKSFKEIYSKRGSFGRKIKHILVHCSEKGLYFTLKMERLYKHIMSW